MTQPWLDDDTLSAVRPQVRRLLERSPGFRALPVEQQRELARTMVRVASYMANPDGLARQELTPGQSVLAHAKPAPRMRRHPRPPLPLPPRRPLPPPAEVHALRKVRP